MKTQDFAGILTALARLVDEGRGGDLRKLASVLSDGKVETTAARVKKMQRAAGHPAGLKVSLEAIQAAFKGAGAAKQATSIGVVLSVFAGRADTPVDAFIAEITATPPQKPRTKLAPPEPDHRLGKEIVEQLRRTVLDTGSFNEVIDRLRTAKTVNTPTLGIIANRFLGNSKSYAGRKAAIDDIVKRQKADAREHARNQALSRIGV